MADTPAPDYGAMAEQMLGFNYALPMRGFGIWLKQNHEAILSALRIARVVTAPTDVEWEDGFALVDVDGDPFKTVATLAVEKGTTLVCPRCGSPCYMRHAPGATGCDHGLCSACPNPAVKAGSE